MKSTERRAKIYKVVWRDGQILSSFYIKEAYSALRNQTLVRIKWPASNRRDAVHVELRTTRV